MHGSSMGAGAKHRGAPRPACAERATRPERRLERGAVPRHLHASLSPGFVADPLPNPPAEVGYIRLRPPLCTTELASPRVLLQAGEGACRACGTRVLKNSSH